MKKSLIIAAAFFIIISSVYSQQSFKLRYNLEKGKTANYVTKANIKMERPSSDNWVSTRDYDYTQSYENSGEGNNPYKITMKYQKFNLTLTSTGREPAINKGEDIIGKKTDYFVNSNGDLTGKDFPDSLKFSLKFQALISNIFIKLPEGEIRIGDKWKTVETDYILQKKEKIKLVINNEYVLEGKEIINGVECLKISCKGNMAYDDTRVGQQSAGGTVIREFVLNFKGKADLNRVIYFDYKRGLPVSVENNLNVITQNQEEEVVEVYEVKSKVSLL